MVAHWSGMKKCKRKNINFRLTSVAQKRLCLSSLIVLRLRTRDVSWNKELIWQRDYQVFPTLVSQTMLRPWVKPTELRKLSRLPQTTSNDEEQFKMSSFEPIPLHLMYVVPESFNFLPAEMPSSELEKLPNFISQYSDTHCLQTTLLIFKFCQPQNKRILCYGNQ